MFQKYKLRKNLRRAIRDENMSGVIEDYEYTNDSVIKTLSVEAQNSKDWVIVAKAKAKPCFVGGSMYLGNSLGFSLDVYDPQFKILDKKDCANGRFCEGDTRFSRRIFNLLLRNYRNGK